MTKSESGEADLDDGSIILNLDRNGLLSDHLSNLRLLNKVLGLVVPVVNGVMVALCKGGLDLKSSAQMLGSKFDEVINDSL